jgi:hypothetical protein
MKKSQIKGFFDLPTKWKEFWYGMPEYINKPIPPYKSISLHFITEKDMIEFSELINQKITNRTSYIYYPKKERQHLNEFYGYISTRLYNPIYPVYIISKGRWESRLTSKALEKINVPYHIVIEPQEYKKYAAVIDPKKILTLPFSNLGQGSIPARNWVWEDSIKKGYKRHWILDDNIRSFFRINNTYRFNVYCGNIFRAVEKFTDRYTNVALSGLNYKMFSLPENNKPPVTLNTRIYSCILIDNNLPYRWRGRYNEDTDLSLRILKDGYCTLLFNAFVADKIATMTMKGGNTELLYKDNGRLKMAQSLQEQHPDVTTIKWKWGRWQHYVDYRSFRKNKLIMKSDLKISKINNEHFMVFAKIKEEE